MPTILGVYPGGHDPSACLLRDGEIVVMIEDERLTRVKHGVLGAYGSGLWSMYNQRWGFFPWASVAYCLETAGIKLDDLDAIVVPHYGRHDCQIVPPLGEEPDGFDWGAVLPIDRRKIIVADEPWGGSHHLMHAFSAFYASPFDQAAVLVIDAAGSITEEGHEAETGLFFESRAGGYREVFKNRYQPIRPPGEALRVEPSLGFMYEQVSGILGFANTRAFVADAGKTMGLAPYGGPSPDFADEWLRFDGFQIDFTGAYQWAFRSGIYRLFSFTDRSRALIQSESCISRYAMDLAYKVQAELERAVVHLAEQMQARTGAANLCLAGGVALNSVANGIISRKKIFKHVWAQPAAADNGQSIGLAYYGHLTLGGGPIRPARHAFGGRVYPHAQIAALLDASGLTFTEFPDDAALAERAAEDLSASRIIGWFQGGSEYGPRALGHRSILADPRGPDIKDRVNERVKFRESFRPFAPAVLKERAAEVFELEEESPYMLIVAPVRPGWAPRVPAITHVDGTARVQTVDREVDPLFYDLIAAFGRRTEVPLVLNTSFNLRGMPIVETPRDALQCFLYTDMDALYLGRFRIAPPSLAQLSPKIARGYSLVAARAQGGARESYDVSLAPDSGEGDRIPLPPAPWVEAFLGALDGKSSAADALAAALGGQPDAETAAEAHDLVRRLLRARGLSVRVGAVWL